MRKSEAAAEDYFNNLKSDPETPSNLIAAAKLKEKLDADEEMTIVSIRQPEDYAKGHIESAINIPFGANMQEAFADLPRDEKVFVLLLGILRSDRRSDCWYHETDWY